MPITQACNLVEAIRFGQFFAQNFVNSKLSSLLRLAALLEELGDINLNLIVPNINNLIPLANITLDVYTELRLACPFLNLPADPAGLEKARAAVADAYARLRSELDNHPWNRMGNLQSRLDEVLSKIPKPPFPDADFQRCVEEALCGTVPTITGPMFAEASSAFNAQIRVFETPVSTIKQDVVYKVSGPGTVTYNGQVYADGDEFVGQSPISFTETGSPVVTTKPQLMNDVQREKRRQVKEITEWINENGTP